MQTGSKEYRHKAAEMRPEKLSPAASLRSGAASPKRRALAQLAQKKEASTVPEPVRLALIR